MYLSLVFAFLDPLVSIMVTKAIGMHRSQQVMLQDTLWDHLHPIGLLSISTAPHIQEYLQIRGSLRNQEFGHSIDFGLSDVTKQYVSRLSSDPKGNNVSVIRKARWAV